MARVFPVFLSRRPYRTRQGRLGRARRGPQARGLPRRVWLLCCGGPRCGIRAPPYARLVTASSMKAVTLAGFEASDAWLAASVMILRGFIRADIRFWFSGLIIRSSLEI